MSGIFKTLIDTAINLGIVSNAHMYDNDFITIEGVTYEGKKFSLTMNIKEENEND